MGKFEALEKAMCKELEMLEEKVKGTPEMSVQDLEKIDKLAHAMKSLATYKAMKEADEYGMDNGMSGRRNAYTGRYMDMGPDGYSGYPGYPGYLPRRW